MADTPKVVLVTGASSGIGRACAALLTARGHIVYGTSRGPAAGTPWRMLELDVTRDDMATASVAQILSEQGRIDVLINNAGMVLAGALEDTSLEEARLQFDTNVLGALRMCKAVLPAMRAQKSGLVINVGSIAGKVGLPFQGLYSASKFALEGLTEALRLEVAPFGISAAIVEPGDIATSVVANRVRAAASGDGSAYREAFVKVVASYEKDETGGASPDVAARTALAIIEKRAPAVRYSTGPVGQRVLSGLKPFLPSKVFEFGLRVFYGLKRG